MKKGNSMTWKIDARCPACNHAVDDASAVGGDESIRPDVGDLAVCIRCAELGIYIDNGDGSLGLREITLDEKVELSKEPRVLQTQQAIRKVASPWLQKQGRG
jgi:hypothetical protein